MSGAELGKNDANKGGWLLCKTPIFPLLLLLLSLTICPWFHCTQAARRKQGLPATWGKRTDADAGRNSGHGTATTYGRSRRKHDRETGGCGTNCRHRAAASVANRSSYREVLRSQPRSRTRKGARSNISFGNILIMFPFCKYLISVGFLSIFATQPQLLAHFDNSCCRLLLRCPFPSSPHKRSMSLPHQHPTQTPRR